MSATPVTIDCDECVMKGTDTCDDCIVTFLCEGPGGVVIDGEEARTVRLLTRAGLAPGLRHRRAG